MSQDGYDKALQQFDVLVMPTLPYPPPRLPEPDSNEGPLAFLNRTIGLVANTCPFNSKLNIPFFSLKSVINIYVERLGPSCPFAPRRVRSSPGRPKCEATYSYADSRSQVCGCRMSQGCRCVGEGIRLEITLEIGVKVSYNMHGLNEPS